MKFSLSLLLATFSWTSGTLFPCPDGSWGNCGRCSSHNDPHITTFDGVYYDQHTDDCFKYVTKCPSYSGYLPFEVCGCHYPCGGGGGPGTGDRQCPSNIRCIGDLSLKFYDTSGSVSYRVKVNHTSVSHANGTSASSSGLLTPGSSYQFDPSGHSFSYSTAMSGNGRIQHTFQIYSQDNSFYGYVQYTSGALTIYLNEAWFNSKACGLCGKFDTNETNDFVGSDGVRHVSSAALSGVGVISTSLNSQINNFANTYVCGSGVPTATDPNCARTSADRACFRRATKCCRQLWLELTSAIPWNNPLVSQPDFFHNWLIGCARDACALSQNKLTNCGTQVAASPFFTFAVEAFNETALATYPVLVPDLPDVRPKNCSVKICAHGDNILTLNVSWDGGATFSTVASETNWQMTLNGGLFPVSPINENTVLRFIVRDQGAWGGFLATLLLCGNNGYQFPIYTSNSAPNYFPAVFETNGDLVVDEYRIFGSYPWSNHVNKERVKCMDERAYWIWNGETRNTMVFELDFAAHRKLLEKLDCFPDPTPAPTQSECCELTVDEYLEQCYCGMEGATKSPTRRRIIRRNVDIGVPQMQAQAQRLQPPVSQGRTAGAHTISGPDSIATDPVSSTRPQDYQWMASQLNDVKLLLHATLAVVVGALLMLLANVSCARVCCVCHKRRGFKSLDASDEEL